MVCLILFFLTKIAFYEDSYKTGRNFRYLYIAMVSGFIESYNHIVDSINLFLKSMITIKCMDAEFYRKVYFVKFCFCSLNFYFYI